MSSLKINPRYDLSIIVIFHNMRREAKRTLLSLTRPYQLNAENIAYEVIAIDNGSTQPLDKIWVESFGENFRYIYFDAHNPSPSEALNYGVQIAQADLITLCIDGARILSPGILYYSALASRIYKDPFIFTLGMHIGSKPQNYLAEESYSQKDEDALIDSVDWRSDGYSLFDISCVALSSGQGYLSKLTESNCITMLRATYQKLGGYDPKFRSAGGGLTNLEFFNRALQLREISPVMLLGEATFHQFHGGTATNVPLKDHPWGKMAEEYQSIYGKSFEPYSRPAVYFGTVHPKCLRLLNWAEENR